jgi:hypothetical protein
LLGYLGQRFVEVYGCKVRAVRAISFLVLGFRDTRFLRINMSTSWVYRVITGNFYQGY